MAFIRHETSVDELKDKTSASTKTDTSVITGVKNHNIKSVKIPPATELQEVVTVDFNRDDALNYTEVRKRFKNLESNANARFTLNELSRRVMSVEEEENIRIESEVKRRMKVIFENLYKKVSHEAHSEGFEAGLIEGKKEILVQLTPAIDSFMQLLASFDLAAVSMAAANEEFIIRIISQITQKILLKSTTLDTDYIKRAILHIIDKVGTKQNIKVFVSAEVINQAQIIKDELTKTLGELRCFTIEADATITDGCRVETDYGTIDATIQTQLEKMDLTLKEGLV